MVKGKDKDKPISNVTAIGQSKSQNGKLQTQSQNTSQKSNNSKKNPISYKGNNPRPRLPMNDDKGLVLCHNCLKSGHMRRECRGERVSLQDLEAYLQNG